MNFSGFSQQPDTVFCCRFPQNQNYLRYTIRGYLQTDFATLNVITDDVTLREGGLALASQ